MVDKNQAIIEYLIECPSIKNSPLYFNFINAKNDNKQILTAGNEKSINRRYIDGSIMKRYTFTIIDFKSIAYKAIVKQPGYPDENVADMLDVQGIIDWITEQNEERNFPDFGEECIIEEISSTTDNPSLNGIDSNVTPALAKYSMAIQVDYLDISKKLWKKGN